MNELEKEPIQQQQLPSEEEQEIDLYPIFVAILDHLKLIIICAIITFGVTAVVCKYFVPETFRSSFTLYVNNKNENTTDITTALTQSDVYAAKSLVYTYSEILKSRTVIEAAIEECGLSYAYSDVSSGITTSVVDDTEIIKVYVEMDTATEAYALATGMINVAPDYIADIVEGSSMKIVEYPVMATYHYRPRIFRTSIIGAFAGALLDVAYVVLKVIVDNRIKDEETLEQRYYIPVLGTIPNIMESYQRKADSYYDYQKKAYKEGSKEKITPPSYKDKVNKTSGSSSSSSSKSNNLKGGK